MQPKVSIIILNWNGKADTEECLESLKKVKYPNFEIILVDDELERVIMKDPAESDIREVARHQGQITMRQDGLLKILAGITDFGEVERVVGTE